MVENQYNKIKTLEYAMKYIKNGTTLMCGGFGGVGTSPLITKAIYEKNVRNLMLISNDAAFPKVGIGPVVCNGQVKKMITTHIGSNPIAGRLMTEKKMKVEFIPQGTFVECIRAGGVGLGGVLVDSGIDTMIRKNYQIIDVNNRAYMVVPAIRAEVGVIYAKKADPYGNLIYDKTARNTNPLMAMACDLTIVHAEEIVPIGELDPEEIITPGVFVDIIVTGEGGRWTWPWQKEN